MTKLRARSDDDKELRRRAILAAARRLLASSPVAELTVADVARAAGLAKGSVFRYFPTREELILAVFEEELAAMFAQLGEALATTKKLSGEALARLLVQGLVARPVFLQLATVVHAVLERNISVDAAVRFKSALLGHLEAAGRALEARWPGLRPGQGARIFLRVHALLIGLWQLCDHPPACAAAIEQAGLDAFRIDFASELEEVLVALLRGMEGTT